MSQNTLFTEEELLWMNGLGWGFLNESLEVWVSKSQTPSVKKALENLISKDGLRGRELDPGTPPGPTFLPRPCLSSCLLNPHLTLVFSPPKFPSAVCDSIGPHENAERANMETFGVDGSVLKCWSSFSTIQLEINVKLFPAIMPGMLNRFLGDIKFNYACCSDQKSGCLKGWYAVFHCNCFIASFYLKAAPSTTATVPGFCLLTLPTTDPSESIQRSFHHRRLQFIKNCVPSRKRENLIQFN